MRYSMEASVEASRLEDQIHQTNYSLSDELKGIEFTPQERVLDAGCGTGVLSRYLVQHRGVRHVDAMDFSDLRLQQAKELASEIDRKFIRFTRQDLSQIDSEFHGIFDTVIARYVVEHVENPLLVLGELHKALKRGGRIVVMELDGVFFNLSTNNDKLNRYLEELKSKVRFDLYIGRKIPQMLKRVGFEQIQWTPQLLVCKGKALEEEYDNTEKRFSAVGPFMSELLGSQVAFEDFRKLYLAEMLKPENTLVFTKYVCTGRKV